MRQSQVTRSIIAMHYALQSSYVAGKHSVKNATPKFFDQKHFVQDIQSKHSAGVSNMRKPFYRAAQGGPRTSDRQRMIETLERSLNHDEPSDDRAKRLGDLLGEIVKRRVGPGSLTLQTFEWIGDRWLPLIVFILGTGRYWHSELHRLVNVFSEQTGATSISQRVLTQKLRTLEDAGLLTRTVWPTVPIRADYELTEHGHGFVALLYQVVDWSAAIEKARCPVPATAL